MKKGKEAIEAKIKALEKEMASAGFWDDKEEAQRKIKEFNDLKEAREGVGKYEKGNAILSIFSGAGGLDSEDFSKMLLAMYLKYIEERGWSYELVHKNENDHGGYRNVTVEIHGKGSYGTLKNESGVHRLVRISPFNANQKRHTSFSMVEVIPKLKDLKEIEIDERDLDIQFARSSGPGGQNVNKRETAVRIIHKPTNISVHVEAERTQERNRETALEILRGKLYHKQEQDREKQERGLSVSKTTENEWGSQIRSYVLHPYKLVKDHRTNVEERDVESVLDGNLSSFIEGERDL